MHRNLQLIYGGVTSREIGCFHNGEYNFSRDINAAYIISQSLSTQLIGQTIINTQSSMVMLTQHVCSLQAASSTHILSSSIALQSHLQRRLQRDFSTTSCKSKRSIKMIYQHNLSTQLFNLHSGLHTGSNLNGAQC